MTFDDFWARYPRRVAKGYARARYAAALKLTSNELLMQGLEASIVHWAQQTKEDPSFDPKRHIPHPSTWLNQERWDDEYEIDLKTDLDRAYLTDPAERTLEMWRAVCNQFEVSPGRPNKWIETYHGPALGQPGCLIPLSILRERGFKIVEPKVVEADTSEPGSEAANDSTG